MKVPAEAHVFAFMRRHLLPLLLALSPLTLTATELVKDDFASADHPIRKATRGPWQIEQGVASCTQDDALYAQHKNHGPVIWYDATFTDAVIQFQVKPDPACKTFVFTLNGADGHVFRFVSSARGTGIRAFPPGAETKSIPLGKLGPALAPDQWTPVTVTLNGTQVTVKIGDSFTETVAHESFVQTKTTLGLGFSFGTLSLKNVSITASKE